MVTTYKWYGYYLWAKGLLLPAEALICIMLFTYKSNFQGIFYSRINVSISIFLNQSATCLLLFAYFSFHQHQDRNNGFSANLKYNLSKWQRNQVQTHIQFHNISMQPPCNLRSVSVSTPYYLRILHTLFLFTFRTPY